MAKGKYGKAAFCPWCGTRSLDRDYFNEHDRDRHVAYLCRLCNVGFTISASQRVIFADRVFAIERQQRIGKG